MTDWGVLGVVIGLHRGWSKCGSKPQVCISTMKKPSCTGRVLSASTRRSGEDDRMHVC